MASPGPSMTGRCRCSGCGRLFGGVSQFDRHRSIRGEHGSCLDPATITTALGERVMFFRDGMWRGPELTDDQKIELRTRR